MGTKKINQKRRTKPGRMSAPVGTPKPKGRTTLADIRMAGEYLKHGSMKKAADSVGLALKYAQGRMRRAATRPDFLAELSKAGITSEYLAKCLKDGMEATKKTYAAFKGEIKDERTDPDWQARAAFIERIHRIRGDFAPEKHDLNLTPEGVHALPPEYLKMVIAGFPFQEVLQMYQDQVPAVQVIDGQLVDGQVLQDSAEGEADAPSDAKVNLADGLKDTKPIAPEGEG